jgi:type II secretion system protein G
MQKQGFTLIELLIVVAIIAILAAIAVPNFLEAQVRSKVARCKADMRSEELAIESYRIDNNQYPPTWSGVLILTTPIAYLTQLFDDPFGPIIAQDQGYTQVLNNYHAPLKSWYIYNGPPTYNNNNVANKYSIRWVLTGLGPDKGWFDNYPTAFGNYPAYDPSNGTVSRGDIERVGPGNIPQDLYRYVWDNKLY